MRSSSVPGMLRAQAADERPLPAAWHRQAAVYATTHCQDDILSALAHRSDSPAELIDTFVASRNPKVRAALLTRPTLPEDRRMSLLKSETRAAVLADAYPHLPEPGRKLVRDRFQQKPTRALAEAILLSRDADGKDRDTTVALAVVSVLSPRVSTLPELSVTRLRQLVRSLSAAPSVELIEAVLPSVSLSRVALAHGGASFSDADAARLVPALFEHSDTPHMRMAHNVTNTLSVLRGLAQAGDLVDAEVRQKMDRLSGAESTLVQAWLNRGSDTSLTVEELAERTASGDEQSATLLVKRADAPFELRVRAAKSVPAEALIALMPEVDEPMRDQIAALAFPYFTEDTWATYPDAHQAQARVLNLILQENADGPHVQLNYYSHHATTACSLVEAIGVSLVRHLPCHIALWRASLWSSTGMARLLAEAAAEDLDEHSWPSYYSLADGWSGTVGELHAACKALAA